MLKSREMKQRRFSPEEIDKMKKLRRIGFGYSTIARVMGTSREEVYHHVKNVTGRKSLAEFLESLLPYLPPDGPPLPKGHYPNWSEIIEALRMSKEEDRRK